jgi:hypothetical protein
VAVPARKSATTLFFPHRNNADAVKNAPTQAIDEYWRRML